MALSHGLAGMGGAAAGAAAVGGYVYLRGVAESYSDEKSQRRCRAVEQALNRTLGRRSLPLPSISSGCVAPNLEPLQCPTPVLQVQAAHEAIVDYQTRRRKDATNPKTLVCELLKTWLREHAMDREIAAKEVQAYRDFCREMIYDKDLWRGSWFARCQFTTMLANVQAELDRLLAVRLRDAGDVRKLFDALKVDAYYYLLRATQVLLLSATTFTVPTAMYSTNLGSLKHSTITPALLKDASEKDLAKEVIKTWQSDAGRLIRAFLEQAHVVALVLEQEGHKAAQSVLPHTTRVIEVLRAENLPNRPAGMDKVDPFVKVKLKKNGETIWDAKTHTLENCSSPQWNEAFFLDLPMEGGCEVILEVVDDNGGALLDTVFAKSEPISFEELLRTQDLKVMLQPNGTLCRDVSSSHLELRFRALDFSQELQAVSLATAKGLRFPELGPMLKDAVEALDNAAYFLDVIRQAAELTKLMGDMGAVLLEAQLQELLGELDDKVQSFQLKATALEDAVADHVMGHERRRRSSLDVASAARRLFTSTSSTDGRARQSSDQLQQMQVKIDQTVSELRKELKAFKGVKDTLGKAQEEAQKLLERLGSEETRRRSGRPNAMVQPLQEGSMKALPAVATPAYTASVSMEIFQKGDQVQVHSAAQNVWFPDGVVEEILPEDSSEGPKGSMRVRYAHGERQKWVRPEEAASILQRL